MGLALVYWAKTPYGVPPDETAHGAYVRAMATTGSLPVWKGTQGPGYEFHHGPLYYFLALPFHALGRLLGLEQPMLMVRSLSMLMGGVSVLLAYCAVLVGFPSRSDLAFACAGFVCLLPTQVMQSSAVSNDVLTTLLFGMVLLLASHVLRHGMDSRTTLVLGTLVGLGLLTKTTCILLYLVVLVAYLLAWRRKPSTAGCVLRHSAVLVATSLLIGGWWLARNHILYGVTFPKFYMQSPDFAHRLGSGCSVPIYICEVIMCAFASFWGAFGHLTVYMPHWTYYALAFLSMLIASGCWFGVRRLRLEAPYAGDMLFLHGATLLFVLLAFAKLNSMCFLAQGRYLLGALAPVSLFWTAGIAGLLPSRHSRLAPLIAIGMQAVLQVVALATCVLPGVH